MSDIYGADAAKAVEVAKAKCPCRCHTSVEVNKRYGWYCQMCKDFHDPSPARLTAVEEPATVNALNFDLEDPAQRIAAAGAVEALRDAGFVIAPKVEEPAKATERIASIEEAAMRNKPFWYQAAKRVLLMFQGGHNPTENQLDKLQAALDEFDSAAPGDVRETDETKGSLTIAQECFKFHQLYLAARQQVAEKDKEIARLKALEPRYLSLSEAVGKPPHSSRAAEHYAADLVKRAEKAEAELSRLRGEFVDQLKRDDQTYETIKKIRDGELKEREK